MILLRQLIQEICGVPSADIEDALATAQMAHLGQKRRSGEPYIEHPMAVADLVYGYYPGDQVLCGAALLHDSFEDAIKLGNIRDAKELTSMIVASFGDENAGNEALRIVRLLTRGEGMPYEEYVLKLSSDPSAIRIKLADMLHNLRSSPSERQIKKYRDAITMLQGLHDGRPPAISAQHWNALLNAADMMRQNESLLRRFIKEAMETDAVRMQLDLDIPDDLQDIHNVFKSAGEELFVVGGAVRDTLLNKTPKDYDLATGADPETVIDIVSTNPDLKVDLTGKSFGVVRVWTPGGNEYEIATFRKDIGTGRRPDAVEFTTIEDDVKRRDLTINALFYDMDSGEVVDYVGGINDLKNNVIRAVGDPSERFQEDKLRILRAARFAGRLGSDLDDETYTAIMKDNDLTDVSPERIHDELLNGMKSSRDIHHFLGILDDLDLFPQIFPGLDVQISGGLSGKNPVIQLALMLLTNEPATVKKVLHGMKYTNREIGVVNFMLSFVDVDRESAPRMKKEFNRIKLDPKMLEEFSQGANLLPKKVNAFLTFVSTPPTMSPKELMAQGLKGPEIGAALQNAEGEAYASLLGELRSYIREMLTHTIPPGIVKKTRSVCINGIPINIEVADTPTTRNDGLMHRQTLGHGDGMLFIFSEPNVRSFWMKNTHVPLSIAYADGNGIILNIEDMYPHVETGVLSSGPATYALEMNQGWFEKNGIVPGNKIEM